MKGKSRGGFSISKENLEIFSIELLFGKKFLIDECMSWKTTSSEPEASDRVSYFTHAFCILSPKCLVLEIEPLVLGENDLLKSIIMYWYCD